MHYLGHVIGQGQIEPNEKKIIAMKDYPQPTTKWQVRAFLGLVGYYRRFLPKMAEMVIPLTALLKKGQPDKVNWTADCNTAFHNTKKALLWAPVLKIANPSKRFILQTDALNQGLWAVLSQYAEDGHDYGKSTMQWWKRNAWLLSRPYINFMYTSYGQEFTIETDHLPLSWLDKMKNKNARLTRWSLQIQPYKFVVKHRKGKEYGNVDSLSRASVNDIKIPGYHLEEEEMQQS